jgi:hypothetical protein
MLLARISYQHNLLVKGQTMTQTVRTTAEKIKKAFDFDKRQSSYYRQASEILGLVISEHGKFKLTSEGEHYVKLPTEQRTNYVSKLLLSFPLMNDIFLQISIDENKKVTEADIIELIKKKTNLTGSTPKRRAQTMISWFKWIQGNIGIVEVNIEKKIKTIQLSRQIRL